MTKTASRKFIGALRVISNDLPLYWPMHPRTKSRIDKNGLQIPTGIHLLDPLGYLDFLHMQAKSAVVLTDSGGIQEESTVLGVPCLTLRENTERPITIECGTNRLAGTRKESILRAWRDGTRVIEDRAPSHRSGTGRQESAAMQQSGVIFSTGNHGEFAST